MKKYEILARFDASGQEVGCGFIEAETALNAIVKVITEKSDDLTLAYEVTAYNSDDDLSATVYFDRYGDNTNYEIHVYDSNGNDVLVSAVGKLDD